MTRGNWLIFFTSVSITKIETSELLPQLPDSRYVSIESKAKKCHQTQIKPGKIYPSFAGVL